MAVTGTFVAAMGYGLLFSFGGTFISAAGMTENEGWCFTLIGLGGLAANPVAGILCDRRDARRLFGVHGLLMGMGVRQVAEGRQATALALQQNAIDVGIASASALYGAVFSVFGAAAAEPFVCQACLIALVGLLLAKRWASLAR